MLQTQYIVDLIGFKKMRWTAEREEKFLTDMNLGNWNEAFDKLNLGFTIKVLF